MTKTFQVADLLKRVTTRLVSVVDFSNASGRLDCRWPITIFVIVCAAACGQAPDSIEDNTALFVDQVSTRVAEVAARENIPIDLSGTIAAVHGEGGAAVFVPTPHDDGRLVGWLDLPRSNPCATVLTPGYYVVEPRFTDSEAFLTIREIDGSGRLDDLSSTLERRADDEELHPSLLRIAFGAEHFSSWGWVKCSDGIGCCRWVLTLDASTPGCN